jgi:hypothetical protein
MAAEFGTWNTSISFTLTLFATVKKSFSISFFLFHTASRKIIETWTP